MTHDDFMPPAFILDDLNPHERKHLERMADRNMRAFQERMRKKERAVRIARNVGVATAIVAGAIILGWYVQVSLELQELYAIERAV